jgi:hypothetical protein
MRRLDEAFERREQIRVSRRLSCALLVSGRRHEGLVREVSADSLLVQTEAELAQGTGVVLSLSLPEGAPLVLEASVRERRPLARSLAAATAPATVLWVEEPPASWLRWVDGEIGKEA